MWCELLGFESRWNARTWVASVVPDFAAKLRPFERQKHFVDFTHSSTDSQLKGSFGVCDELFVPSDNADFLACELSKIIHSPGNDFVPPFFPRLLKKLDSLDQSPAVTQKHLIVKIFPPLHVSPPFLHKWPAGLASVFFYCAIPNFLVPLSHQLCAERSRPVKRASWSTRCVLMFGATHSLSLTLLSSSDVLCSSLKHPLHLRISIRVMVRLLCVIRLQNNINNNNKNNSSLWSEE